MQMGNYRFNEALAMELVEKFLIAAVILLVTWALAKAAKWAFAKLVDNVQFFRRGTGSGDSVGTSLGKIVSLFIWLFGLVAILTIFDLGSVMAPVQNLLNSIVGFIPNLIGAALIFFVGLMVARIVRDIAVTAMQTVDFDRWANRGGAQTATGNATISKTIGTIIYVLIAIPVVIMALEALNLETISEPASDMLRMVLSAIPNIIGAAILLGIGYLISRFVVDILKQLLTGLGVDRAVSDAGIVATTTSVSGVIARVVQVAIVLFFAVAATRLLGFPELTDILNQVLELGGQVIFGAVVIGVGFLLANLLSRMIDGSGDGSIAGTIVKYATMLVFTFMGLRFMGVGEEIVDMAFGALVIGGAVAAALAFGLGGREWAGRKLEEMDDKTSDMKNTPDKSDKVKKVKVAKTPAAPRSDKPLPPGA